MTRFPERTNAAGPGRVQVLALALVSVMIAWLGWHGPPGASAHQGDPNYRTELAGVKPATLGDGLVFSVGNYDDFIALSNRSGRMVVVEGYRGEPYLRFLRDGTVQANTRSPAWFANRDRYGEVRIPATADPEAPPRWRRVSGEGRYAWHDHRSHWMGPDDPPQITDRSARTEVFDFAIPMQVGGSPAALTGTLFWVGSGGGPPLWLFLFLGAVAAAGLAWIAIRRRRDSSATRQGPGGP